jgi:prolipoprotein diacylglyceryltransferase
MDDLVETPVQMNCVVFYVGVRLALYWYSFWLVLSIMSALKVVPKDRRFSFYKPHSESMLN